MSTIPETSVAAMPSHGSDSEFIEPQIVSNEGSITIIEARPGWKFIDLKEMWRYRELLYFLVWRDVKVRYKQTVLGALWAILQPLATMVVFSLFFGRLAQIAYGRSSLSVVRVRGLTAVDLFFQCDHRRRW